MAHAGRTAVPRTSNARMAARLSAVEANPEVGGGLEPEGIIDEDRHAGDRARSAQLWQAELSALEAKEQVRQLESLLQSMTRSTSWRITAPLRTAKNLLDMALPQLRSSRRWLGASFGSRLPSRTGSPASGLTGAPRLLVDVTGIAQADPRLGIQRTARNLVAALPAAASGRRDICPVRAEGNTYFEAGRFASEIGLGPDRSDSPLSLHPTDTYLSLDLFPAVSHWGEWFSHLKVSGVPVYVVLYDLLPILRPSDFTNAMRVGFERWLSSVLEHAAGIICISRSVADELLEMLSREPRPRESPLQIGYFHLGVTARQAQEEIPDELADRSAEVPRFLMVGTVEPRKRHLQALQAFELLWSQGLDAILVIVGRQGWLVEDLANRIRNHPEKGKRLFWFESAGDEVLAALYDRSSALLAASAGEGFGLPLIEAASRGVPIVARDLPVFREVVGDHAFYFRGEAPEDLALALTEWTGLFRSRREPQSTGLRVLTWRESAERLIDMVDGRSWYRTVA